MVLMVLVLPVYAAAILQAFRETRTATPLLVGMPRFFYYSPMESIRQELGLTSDELIFCYC